MLLEVHTTRGMSAWRELQRQADADRHLVLAEMREIAAHSKVDSQLIYLRINRTANRAVGQAGAAGEWSQRCELRWRVSSTAPRGLADRHLTFEEVAQSFLPSMPAAIRRHYCDLWTRAHELNMTERILHRVKQVAQEYFEEADAYRKIIRESGAMQLPLDINELVQLRTETKRSPGRKSKITSGAGPI
jgi:hypothetical protein